MRLLFLFVACFVVATNGGVIKDLYNRLKNYKTDYSVDEIIRLLLRGTKLTVKHLCGEVDDTPIEEDVTFWAINRETNELRQVWLKDPNIAQKLDFSKPVAFVIHGWIDNVNRTWVQETVKDYVKFVDTNVIAVDWNRLANYEYAISAMRNVHMVAAHLADFIKSLRDDHQVSFDNVTLVGHSLGGQISGLTGGLLDGKIGQIFALDPAGPLFTHPVVRSLKNRLDPTDAQFVQAIYTTRYILGCGIEVAHQNFKPNVGIVPQPPCVVPTVTGAISPEMVSCSHSHATELFRYALNPEHHFLGRKCSSGMSYVTGMCFGQHYERLGIYAKREEHGNFYLQTSAVAPYV
ncbi:endothelial lipase-like [Culicoides brevitarsis]|uniref:endothelial lipase-like n=1 Tax=Culicoides brevitarsis TaxID=469753 RepID=UPI00307BD9ED